MAVMTRITTNMIQRNYQNNLTSTLGGLESSRRQVETGRRFEHSYEDPAASAKAAILEKRYARVQDYLDNAANAQSWQNTQEDAAMEINTHAITISKTYSVDAVNGTNQDPGVRETYATALETLQDSMVSALNARYGETFVLAGNKGKEPAFTLEDKNGDGMRELYYRDVAVDTLTDTAEGAALLEEHSFVDVGFGMTIGAGDQVVASSAFDTALPGVKLVGYDTSGETVTINGAQHEVSNNLINLAGQMAALLREEGAAVNIDEYRKCWEQFEVTADSLRNTLSAIGTKTQLLKATTERLESEKLAIETQFDDAVNIEPAEAIMNYSWADYAYNSALKVGSSIISPSLLDFIQG